jgi:hypothetical protein
LQQKVWPEIDFPIWRSVAFEPYLAHQVDVASRAVITDA